MKEWKEMLNGVVEMVKPEAASHELAGFRQDFDDDPEMTAVALSGFIAEFFINTMGLFAILGLPVDEALTALDEIETRLHDLDLETGRDELSRRERQVYEPFAELAGALYPRLGTAMRAVLGTYAQGDYDPQADPDELIQRGLELGWDAARQEQGREMIVQAGAVALHGPYPWWRWSQEADGPLAPWVRDLFLVIDGLTNQGRTPLGPIDQARVGYEQIRSSQEESELAGASASDSAEPSPVDQLLKEIIERGEESFDPEWEERARALGDEAIQALIGLAADEEMGMMDAPGEGYGPIRAVNLLGELRAAEAAPVLIDLAYDCDPMVIVFSRALWALEKIGPPAVEPILTCLRYSRDIEGKIHLCEPLGKIGQGNEQVYQAMAELLEQATWEDGKSLVVSALANLGDERALPLLYPLLDEPEIDYWDWGSLCAAIEDLGGEVGQEFYEPDDSTALDIQETLQSLTDLDSFASFVAAGPPEWQEDGGITSHTYTRILEMRLLGQTLMLVSGSEPDEAVQTLKGLIANLDELDFDADLSQASAEVRAGYQHLAECAGPYLQRYSLGLWLTFLHYADGEYDLELDPTPDDLLAVVQAKAEIDPQDRANIGRAGAKVLRGRPLWSLWPSQLGRAVGEAVRAILYVREILQKMDMYPLPPVNEWQDQPDQAIDPFSTEPPSQVIQDLIDQLFQIRPGTDKPRNALLRQFKKHRAKAIPELTRLLTTHNYWNTDAPGGGWTPILAARLLAFLQAYQAADELVRAAVEGDWEEAVRDAALTSLIALGEPALPAVRNYFRYGREDEGRVALAEVLGRIGRQDPQSFDLLSDLWERVDWPDYKRLVAAAFGALGDERAIPLLRAGLEDKRADVLDRDYMAWALATLEGNRPPTCTQPSRLGRNRVRLPELHRARLIADEQDRYHLPNYTLWGALLCPDCGGVLVLDSRGDWVHPADSREGASKASRRSQAKRPSRQRKKRKRRRKKRKR